MRDDKPLPHSLEAERHVLGALMIEPTAWDRVSGRVSRGDFFSPGNALVFGALEKLGGHGDLLSVKEKLRESGDLERAGGSAYISSLIEVPDLGGLSKWARIIQEKSAARRAIVSMHRLSEELYEGAKAKERAGEMLDIASDIVAKSEGGARPISEIALLGMQRIETRMASRSIFTGIPSGIPTLDKRLLGFQRGVLTIVAARPRVGKSLAAISFALNAAAEGYRVAYYSLELPADTLLYDRILAAKAGVKNWKIKSPFLLDDSDLMDMTEANNELLAWGKAGRFLVNDSFRECREIIAEARRETRKKPLDLVIVDYLQIVQGGRGEKKTYQIDDMLLRFLDAAKETKAAFVLLAQLNREGGREERPTLENLKDSGSIEQTGRAVILLDRPRLRKVEEHKDGTPARLCQLFMYIEKNGEGEGGDVECHIELETQRISEGSCYVGCRYWEVQ